MVKIPVFMDSKILLIKDGNNDDTKNKFDSIKKRYY